MIFLEDASEEQILIEDESDTEKSRKCTNPITRDVDMSSTHDYNVPVELCLKTSIDELERNWTIITRTMFSLIAASHGIWQVICCLPFAQINTHFLLLYK